MQILDLGHMVKRLQHRHHRTADTLLIEVGTTLAQWDALRAISRCPEASAHRLAVMTFQTDQSFGQLANRLIASGLVERTPGYGRAFKHTLTADGQAIMERGGDVLLAMLERSFSPLDDAEKAQLFTLLTKVVEG